MDEEKGERLEDGSDEHENVEEETAGMTEEKAPVGHGPEPKGGVPIPAVIAIAVVALLIGAALGGLVGFLATSGDDDEDDEGDGNEKIPKLELDADSAGFAGAYFLFNLTLTGDGVENAVVTWTFGDGTAASGLTATHVYASAGTYHGKVEAVIGGKTYSKTFDVTVQAVPVQPGILPAGDPLAWTLNFTGACAGKDLTIANLVGNESAIVRSNITLEGDVRSFLGVPLPYVIDLADARFDAGPFTAIGDTTYTSSVQRAMFLPRNNGNETLIVFAEGGKWLNGTELGTPLMLLGEDPAAGDVVKDLKTIDLDPFLITLDGPGVISPIEADYDLMVEMGSNNYTVMDGTSTFVFTGVPVLSLLEEAGLARNATTVKIGSTDGYVVDFLMDDVLENPESPDPFFLAFKVDGEYLPALEGPYRLITPDADYTEDDGHNWYHQTWIKTVVHIEVETSGTPSPPLPWGSPIDGTINITWNGGSKLYTSSEMAMLWDEIVSMQATMVKKTGTKVTNNYSGIPLLRLLEISGAPTWAGNLTVSSSDGYSKWIDPMAIHIKAEEEGNDTMVALTEGGAWLGEGSGPFRLVSSGLSSAYWISQLSKVEVDTWQFRVNGTMRAIEQVVALPKVDVTVESKGKTLNYSGADLLSYLTGLGMGPGTGSIVVAGYDYSDGTLSREGYAKTIDLRWFEGLTASEMPLLAYELEGSPLGYSSMGPLRLVIPTQAGKYWIGSVTSIEYVPWSLTIIVDGAYHNITADDVMALQGHDGILRGYEGAGGNVTAVGCFIADLLAGLGVNLSMNATFKDAQGNALSLSLMALTSFNASGVFTVLAWEVDGASLYPWTGLFLLVLPWDMSGDESPQWMKGVVSIEV